MVDRCYWAEKKKLDDCSNPLGNCYMLRYPHCRSHHENYCKISWRQIGDDNEYFWHIAKEDVQMIENEEYAYLGHRIIEGTDYPYHCINCGYYPIYKKPEGQKLEEEAEEMMADAWEDDYYE